MDKFSFRYRHLKIQYQFSVSAPYLPGHQLTAGEAQALNQLRAENIRENMRKVFTRVAQSTTEGVLSPEEIAQVKAEIDQYDWNYQFPETKEMSERLGAIEREARMLAAARSPEGASEEEITALAESIDLVAEARQRVAARAQIARNAIEELLT